MSDYQIGYCKPPKQHQFKPGQSGNPKGRPRKPKDQLTIDDAEILRRLDAEEITVKGEKMTRREAEIRQILAATLKGDRKARRLFNRLKKSIVKQRRGGVVHAPLSEFERMWKDDEKQRKERGAAALRRRGPDRPAVAGSDD